MAGVDLPNQFPNSRMARAVKLGQSRFMSVDAPTLPRFPGQDNVAIAAVTTLTIPSVGADAAPVTYAVITAIGGPLYLTYDGSVPSAANYAVTLAPGQSLPVQGPGTLAAVKVIGTTMSVSYWS